MRQSSKSSFPKLPEMLKGSLGQVKMKCGKKNCRCRQGKFHSAYFFSFRKDGKTETIYIPKDLVKAVDERCQKWKRYKVFLEKETQQEIQRLVKSYQKRGKS